MHGLNYKKGFTLIELVIVIAVLGILAGLAIPRFLDHLAESRTAVCESNRVMLARAYSIYLAKGGSLTLAEYVTSPDTIEKRDYYCPSQGTYTVDGEENIICSYHGKIHSEDTGDTSPSSPDI